MQKSPKFAICATSHKFIGLYLPNEGMYRQSEKNLFNSNVSPTCPHNMVNFGPLAAEICWRVWGIPANFKGFRVLASLLHRHRSTDVNQTLHDVWPSAKLEQCIYIFGALIVPGAEFTFRPSLAFCWQRLLHGTPAVGKLCGSIQQKAPPIFGWSAITLGIGRHSSL